MAWVPQHGRPLLDFYGNFMSLPPLVIIILSDVKSLGK
jgi:hypothetical protein